MTCAIDESYVFSVISFGVSREVVCRCKPLMPGFCIGVLDHIIKTEFFAMIILIVDIEHGINVINDRYAI